MAKVLKVSDLKPKKFERNPFAPAEGVDKKIKLFLWGATGTGKTRLALQFPKPVVIDMERGTDRYNDEFGFAVRRVTDADELMAAIQWLVDNDHPYETLVIDPITIYWEALQQKWLEIFIRRNRGGKGDKEEFYNLQTRDWIHIKSEFKDFCRKLINLDMHIIVTAREKVKYADGEFMKAIGETFDGEKSLPYLFDTIVRIWKSKGQSMGLCLKDRSFHLPEDKPFLATYKAFSNAFGLRNGKEGTAKIRGTKVGK